LDTCQYTDGGATGVRSGRRPQIPFLPLVKHTSKVPMVAPPACVLGGGRKFVFCRWSSSKVLDVLTRDPERSKYRTAACRPDAKWSAAAGRPTSPHLNRDSVLCAFLPSPTAILSTDPTIHVDLVQTTGWSKPTDRTDEQSLN